MMIALFVVAVLVALLFATAGVRLIRRNDVLVEQRDAARAQAVLQADESERLHAAVQRACTTMRNLMESQDSIVDLENMQAYVTEFEV